MYETVARTMGGLRETQEFYRLFMVPGMTHCYFGPGASSFGGVGQQLPPCATLPTTCRQRSSAG